MVQFKWIKKSLFVILALFTAVTGQNSFTVRVGDEVTLPCENVIKNQDKCDSTSWIATKSSWGTARELVTLGKISQTGISKDKSDRLSVTENCFLVIKKVTVEDVGRYTCRQFISGQQQGPDSVVYLSVITMTEHQTNERVIWFCAVLTYEGCGHSVKWLYDDDDDKIDTEISQYTCASSVAFTIPHLKQKSNYYELCKCNMTDDKRGQTLLCDVGPQSSCERTGSKGNNKTAEDDTSTQDWWRFLIVSVGLAALLTIVVAVNIWTKTKGNRTQMDEHIELTSNPAGTQPAPETSQGMVRLILKMMFPTPPSARRPTVKPRCWVVVKQ
ncbi:uncharacterized protein LOC127368577 isoform X10 [Dicentrarchus labrax]|uniref:uncharacterized protein LOC127368577 isoform X10 n=1 Tax=Dicentrarchus labrax TaxID=13489 RepID=UPI0021F65D3F|nr:uncharacterized protein LOC127368577 isoform X10 [Dicentrarchus labrax]